MLCAFILFFSAAEQQTPLRYLHMKEPVDPPVCVPFVCAQQSLPDLVCVCLCFSMFLWTSVCLFVDVLSVRLSMLSTPVSCLFVSLVETKNASLLCRACRTRKPCMHTYVYVFLRYVAPHFFFLLLTKYSE